MARKSRADRVHEILRDNPALRRDDQRISELINAETLLRKAQRLAKNAPLTVLSAAGTAKRSPEWVTVDSVDRMVRRLRNDMGIDRLNVKRNEAAGVKVKRSAKADAILETLAFQFSDTADLMPNLAAAWAAYGIVAEDLPECQQERFRSDLEEQEGYIGPIRDSLRRHGML